MKNNIYYIGIAAWALFSACSAEYAEEKPGEEAKGEITLRATDISQGSAFKQGQRIIVYNSVYPKDVTNPEQRGIYVSPETEKKEDAWTNIPVDKEDATKQALGLWYSDIKPDNGEYYFTAISYSDGQSMQEEGVHQIESDQSTEANYIKSDFLVARTTYSGDDWKKDGVSLLFYHVLSQLEIRLYLPIGGEKDGLFPETIKDTQTKSMTLKSTTLDYQVDYSIAGLPSGRSARVSEIKENGVGPTEVKMLPPSTGISGEDVVIPNENTKAVMFNFNAIIPPHQYYPSGRICLNINIDGKTYSYAPDADGLFSFAQGQKTIIYLVLYSKKGSVKVKLAGVKVTPWKNDKTDIGDLIED